MGWVLVGLSMCGGPDTRPSRLSSCRHNKPARNIWQHASIPPLHCSAAARLSFDRPGGEAVSAAPVVLPLQASTTTTTIAAAQQHRPRAEWGTPRSQWSQQPTPPLHCTPWHDWVPAPFSSALDSAPTISHSTPAGRLLPSTLSLPSTPRARRRGEGVVDPRSTRVARRRFQFSCFRSRSRRGGPGHGGVPHERRACLLVLTGVKRPWGEAATEEVPPDSGRGGAKISPGKMRRSASLFQVLLVFTTVAATQWSTVSGIYCKEMSPNVYRPHSVTITEFGAVGDGVTLNTKAFQNAIFYLNSFADKGGAQLFVPAGKWLTGSFGLISHLTLSLDKDAVIIGSPDSSDWPAVDPLPSYGRGRELPGKRHQSLIFGSYLTDVIITGANGTIDGQGATWWGWFHNHTLNYTRPHLVELMYSTNVVISNLTFKNSPFWNIHPVYCSQVLVQHVTILAPLNSPNTDGIDLDSSTNVCINHCYVRNGDDVIVIKSGWDEYGISVAQPSSNISISNVTGETRGGAGIAFGSEMSGGISEVRAEGLRIVNSLHGIRIKTAPGRGGYVKNVYIADVSMENVSMAIRITGNYGEHPDDKYDRNALPMISNITIKDVVGINIGVAGILEGIEGDNFSSICLSNVSLIVQSPHPWNCSLIEGYSNSVIPESCEQLRSNCRQTSVCYDGSTSSAMRVQAPRYKSSTSPFLSPFLKLASF